MKRVVWRGEYFSATEQKHYDIEVVLDLDHLNVYAKLAVQQDHSADVGPLTIKTMPREDRS